MEGGGVGDAFTGEEDGADESFGVNGLVGRIEDLFEEGDFLFLDSLVLGNGFFLGVDGGGTGGGFGGGKVGVVEAFDADDGFEFVLLFGDVAVGVADAEEGGLLEDDGSDGVGERAVHDFGAALPDGANFADADLVEFAVGGLAVEVGDFKCVGAAEFEDAVGGGGVAENGFDAAHEGRRAGRRGEAEDFFAIAGGGFDEDFDALGAGHRGEVLVVDADVEALADFEAVGFGGVFAEGGADVFEGFDGAVEAAEFEVALADVEVGVVAVRGVGEILNDFAESGE